MKKLCLVLVLALAGCSHAVPAVPKAPTPMAAAGIPSGDLDPRVPPVQGLVETFVHEQVQHFTTFRLLAQPIAGLAGQHGQARGWLSDEQGHKTADFRVEFVAFEDLTELRAAKGWIYPVEGKASVRTLGDAAKLVDQGVNGDPDGPAIQWQAEAFLQRDVKPGATPHFTTFRLLSAPLPGWEGQHFSANGWLSTDGKHATDAIYVEGAFDRDGGVLRTAKCFRFPQGGGKPVVYSSSPRSLARML